MKNKSLFILPFLFVLGVIIQPSLQAQKAAPTAKAPNVIFCDDLIPNLKKELQTRADGECSTMKTCVECKERQSGEVIFATLVLQPRKAACRTAAEISDAEAEKSVSKLPQFQVEVLQTPCSRVGTTLEVFIPGNDSPDGKDDYKVEWIVDGKKVADSRKIDCIRSNSVTVQVTQISTRVMVRKLIRFPAVSTGNENPAYKTAGFAKTACFGTCPVYEVEFYTDGKVTWNGRLNVERMGKYEAKVSPDLIRSIVAKAEAVKFFSFNYEYPDYVVYDAPSTITYLRVDDMVKEVKHTLEGPQGLVEYENFLENVIKGIDWRPARG